MKTIYKLEDPETKELMYIGITNGTIYQRLADHIHEGYHRKRTFSHKGTWITRLFDRGLIPIISVIEETDDSLREKYWIEQLQPRLNIIFGNDEAMFKHVADAESIPVYQYRLDGTYVRQWKSATEVELILGIDNTNISSCLTGKRQQSGGYMWKPFKVEALMAYSHGKSEKPIHRWNKKGGVLIKSYQSARAAEVDGFKFKGISKVLRGSAKQYMGNYFTYQESKI